jgi:hypothetical protein
VKAHWIYCSDCHRYFKGRECHDLHKKNTQKGKSTFSSYYKCILFDQTINVGMHKHSHACGEVYCKTCKDYYDKDHQCYMTPVEVDEKCAKYDNTVADEDMDDEDDTDEDVYIFFYFECTQDALIECVDVTTVENQYVGHLSTNQTCALFIKYARTVCTATSVQKAYVTIVEITNWNSVELTLQLPSVSGYSPEKTMVPLSCATISKDTTHTQS